MHTGDLTESVFSPLYFCLMNLLITVSRVLMYRMSQY